MCVSGEWSGAGTRHGGKSKQNVSGRAADYFCHRGTYFGKLFEWVNGAGVSPCAQRVPGILQDLWND